MIQTHAATHVSFGAFGEGAHFSTEFSGTFETTKIGEFKGKITATNKLIKRRLSISHKNGRFGAARAQMNSSVKPAF